jgi:hypothetical protein
VCDVHSEIHFKQHQVLFVIPAKAGIHLDFLAVNSRSKWTPAFAGVTKKLVSRNFLSGAHHG